VNSKLCNLWFAYELNRRLAASHLTGDGRELSVNAFDPGLVPGSGLARDYPPVLRFVWDRVLPGAARLLSPFVPSINPAPKSGGALVHFVIDPALAGVSGKYFPSHARLAGSGVVSGLLRRRASGRPVGGERPPHQAHVVGISSRESDLSRAIGALPSQSRGPSALPNGRFGATHPLSAAIRDDACPLSLPKTPYRD
jgi:hypothetical protein